NASTGLRTWVSTDGTDWELRSVIEENYEVNTVISSRFGLLAAGFDPANGDGLVWQSADGNTWTQMLVSAAPVPRSGRIVSAVATDELVYIRSETQGRADHRGPAEQA